MVNTNSGGIVASRGFLFQYLVAIQECFKLTGSKFKSWRIDVEDESHEISDITIYIDEKIAEIHQIKMSSNIKKTIGPSDLLEITERLFQVPSPKYKVYTNRKISDFSLNVLNKIKKIAADQDEFDSLKDIFDGKSIKTYEKYKDFIGSSLDNFKNLEWASNPVSIPEQRDKVRKLIIDYRINHNLERLGPFSNRLIVSSLIDTAFQAGTGYSPCKNNKTSIEKNHFIRVISSDTYIFGKTLGFKDWHYSAGTLPPAIYSDNYIERIFDDQLEKYFNNNNKNNKNTVLISGLSGIGKTLIAHHYIEKNINVKYDLVLWIDATTEENILNSLKELIPKDSIDSEQYYIHKFREFLEAHNDRIAVVFDNSPNAQVIINKYIPTQSNANFIITSQNQNSLAVHNILVSEFTALETNKYLSNYELSYQDHLSGKIHKTSGGLPLALNVVCAYLITLQTSLDRENFVDSILEAALEYDEPSGGYPVNALAAISSVLSKISDSNADNNKNRIIDFIAYSYYCQSELVPIRLLSRCVFQNLSPEEMKIIENSHIIELLKFSLIRHNNRTNTISDYSNKYFINTIVRKCAYNLSSDIFKESTFLNVLVDSVSSPGENMEDIIELRSSAGDYLKKKIEVPENFSLGLCTAIFGIGISYIFSGLHESALDYFHKELVALESNHFNSHTIYLSTIGVYLAIKYQISALDEDFTKYLNIYVQKVGDLLPQIDSLDASDNNLAIAISYGNQVIDNLVNLENLPELPELRDILSTSKLLESNKSFSIVQEINVLRDTENFKEALDLCHETLNSSSNINDYNLIRIRELECLIYVNLKDAAKAQDYYDKIKEFYTDKKSLPAFSKFAVEMLHEVFFSDLNGSNVKTFFIALVNDAELSYNNLNKADLIKYLLFSLVACLMESNQEKFKQKLTELVSQLHSGYQNTTSHLDVIPDFYKAIKNLIDNTYLENNNQLVIRYRIRQLIDNFSSNI